MSTVQSIMPLNRTNICPRNHQLSRLITVAVGAMQTSKPWFDQKCAKDSADGVDEILPKTLRSSIPGLTGKDAVFFCNQLCDRRDTSNIGRLQMLEIRDCVLVQCAVHDDAWCLEVLGRLKLWSDLAADEAVYHVKSVTLIFFTSCNRTKSWETYG